MAKAGWLMSLGLLMLAGCGTDEPLPPPGATDGTIHLWRPGNERASVMRFERMIQVGPDPQQLDLFHIRIRLPLADGVLAVRAPSGRYRALDDDPLLLQGPLALSGYQGAEPFTGHAATAALVDGGSKLVLSDVVLVQNGQHLVMTQTTLTDLWDQALAGQAQHLSSKNAEAAVVAALAALPASAAAAD